MIDDPENAMPIAVDSSYLLRDNQFWYNDCSFADTIRDQPTITVRVEGLGVRMLTHAKPSQDGRPTTSFTLPTGEDLQWWEHHRKERVRVELLSIKDESPWPTQQPAEAEPILSPHATIKVAGPDDKPSPNMRGADFDGATLCIGLDIAWFGGSKDKPASQYDFLASVIVDGESGGKEPEFTRVSLGKSRDPSAQITLTAIREMIQKNSSVKRIVFALDAPIQARERQLPQRQPCLKKGEKGKIKRRACEDQLEANRKAIDKSYGGSSGWNPNIQSGAPLAPRVQHLINGLKKLNFELWTPNSRTASKLAIECFPAEAIWAAKRLEGFRSEVAAPCAKAYKQQDGSQLNEEQVKKLVHDVLHGFEALSGNKVLWKRLVEEAIEWMLHDQAWQTADGSYRGGKLLDDVVDTMICLVTSLSYTQQCAHVWFDADHSDDGHIIGPGYQDDGRWVDALPAYENEVSR